MIQVVHPGLGSRIRIRIFKTHPGSRIQGSKGAKYRIRIRNTEATVYHIARIFGAHLFEKPDQRSPSAAGLRIRLRKDLSPCD